MLATGQQHLFAFHCISPQLQPNTAQQRHEKHRCGWVLVLLSDTLQGTSAVSARVL